MVSQVGLFVKAACAQLGRQWSCRSGSELLMGLCHARFRQRQRRPIRTFELGAACSDHRVRPNEFEIQQLSFKFK